MKNILCILTIFILNINFLEAQGHLVFKQKEIVVDSVDKDKIRATFYFTNAGSYIIRIKSVTASFDWCVPNYNNNVILQPGQTDSIWISCITSYTHQQGNFLVTTQEVWDGNDSFSDHGGWNTEEYHLKITYTKTSNSTAKEISITKATTLKTSYSKGDTIGICVTGTIQVLGFWRTESEERLAFNLVWKNAQGGYDTLWPRDGWFSFGESGPSTITVKDKIVYAEQFWEWVDLRKLPYGEYKILLYDGNFEYKATNSFVITE